MEYFGCYTLYTYLKNKKNRVLNEKEAKKVFKLIIYYINKINFFP
jgi:hypothetical protein